MEIWLFLSQGAVSRSLDSSSVLSPEQCICTISHRKGNRLGHNGIACYVTVISSLFFACTVFFSGATKAIVCGRMRTNWNRMATGDPGLNLVLAHGHVVLEYASEHASATIQCKPGSLWITRIPNWTGIFVVVSCSLNGLHVWVQCLPKFSSPARLEWFSCTGGWTPAGVA